MSHRRFRLTWVAACIAAGTASAQAPQPAPQPQPAPPDAASAPEAHEPANPDRQRAEQIALEVHGVESVVNELTVAEPISAAAALAPSYS